MSTTSMPRLAILLSGAIASALLMSPGAAALLQSQAPAGTQQPAAAGARDELMAALLATPPDRVPKPAEGQPVFEKLCAACHRFGDLGTDVGPDLTTLNSRFKKKDILESILWPSKIISDQYEAFMIETTGGDIITGAVVMEDDRRIVLRTAQDPDRPVQVAKSQIKTQQKSTVSLMPEELLTGLSHQEINGLIAFLQAGPKNP
jgi:putative heme-binding domain-containing protein